MHPAATQVIEVHLESVADDAITDVEEEVQWCWYDAFGW